MPVNFWNAFYQQKCFSCGKTINNPCHSNGEFRLICHSCVDTIKPIHSIEGKKCRKCCAELYSSSKDYCYNCSQTDFIFNQNTSIFYYKDPLIQELMQLFKFKSNISAGNDLAWILKPEIELFFQKRKPDEIIITPLSKDSFKKRGYNQVEFLLKKCGISYKNLLIRTKHKKHQSELTAQERREWIKGQFFLKQEENFQGKTILIVDDVYTTGSTVNEISSVFKNHNADSINVLTFFKD